LSKSSPDGRILVKFDAWALRDARVNLSSTAAWRALETIRHVRFQVNGETKTGVTQGSAHARQVLRALQISDLRPPTPAGGEDTTT